MELNDQNIRDKVQIIFNILDWTLTPEQIKERSEELKKIILKNVLEFESIPKEDRSFENTLWDPSLFSASVSQRISSLRFPNSVSTDQKIRNTSSEIMQDLSKFFIELSMREESYNAIKDYDNKNENLDPVAKKLLEKEIQDYERNGLALPKDKRIKLLEIRKKISSNALKFQQNLVENTDYLLFSEEDLEGVSPFILKALAKIEDNQLQVDITRSNWYNIILNCKVSETRRKIDEAWNKRCNDVNPQILEEIVQLRYHAVQLLGFESHADFVIDNKMAKTTKSVINFQNELIERLQPYAKEQIKTLVKLKNDDLGRDSDGEIHHYDWRYYTQMYKEKEFDLDLNKIQEYFPTDHVIKAMLEFYQEIFGFVFYEIKNSPTWHDDVSCFGITDTESNEFKGVFYLDLFPRPGKYGHAAAFPLVSGRQLKDGSYHPTAAAMVANFNKPTPDQPALMSFEQVETLFHEFGHIIHQTTTQAKFTRFSGSSVARDFVEAPSQMLENWVLEKEVLARISKHYENGEPIPNELRLKLVKSRKIMQGLDLLRQLFFGTFDIECYTCQSIKSKELWDQIHNEVVLITPPPESNGAGTMAHIISGYDAGYYGYLWSRVIAQDLYTRFEKEGVTSNIVGMDYRRYILEPGSEDDEIHLVENFLSRKTNNDAFMRYIGLS